MEKYAMTNEEKKKIYAALAAPFPENAIQRTEGRVTGRGYDTVGIGYAFITARLNEVLGLGNWRAHRTVTVKQISRANGRPAYEAICDITLELGAWSPEGNFLPWAEALADGGHVATSEADARKGAYTNALKKAAAMFGCGRQAYEGTLDDDNVPAERDAHHEPPKPSLRVAPQLPPAPGQPRSAPSTPSKVVVPPRSRLTSKQLACVWALGRRLSMEQAALRGFVKAKFGVAPEFLTRDQASSLIAAMSEQAGNGEDLHREPGMEG
jgi:hypothetical protein